jgi:hypothetical protein
VIHGKGQRPDVVAGEAKVLVHGMGISEEGALRERITLERSPRGPRREKDEVVSEVIWSKAL